LPFASSSRSTANNLSTRRLVRDRFLHGRRQGFYIDFFAHMFAARATAPNAKPVLATAASNSFIVFIGVYPRPVMLNYRYESRLQKRNHSDPRILGTAQVNPRLSIRIRRSYFWKPSTRGVVESAGTPVAAARPDLFSSSHTKCNRHPKQSLQLVEGAVMVAGPGVNLGEPLQTSGPSYASFDTGIRATAFLCFVQRELLVAEIGVNLRQHRQRPRIVRFVFQSSF